MLGFFSFKFCSVFLIGYFQREPVTEFFFKTDLPDRASTMYNLLARRTNALARILHQLSLHY